MFLLLWLCLTPPKIHWGTCVGHTSPCGKVFWENSSSSPSHLFPKYVTDEGCHLGKILPPWLQWLIWQWALAEFEPIKVLTAMATLIGSWKTTWCKISQSMAFSRIFQAQARKTAFPLLSNNALKMKGHSVRGHGSLLWRSASRMIKLTEREQHLEEKNLDHIWSLIFPVHLPPCQLEDLSKWLYYGAELCPFLNSYIESLTPSTSECDYIWK